MSSRRLARRTLIAAFSAVMLAGSVLTSSTALALDAVPGEHAQVTVPHAAAGAQSETEGDASTGSGQGETGSEEAEAPQADAEREQPESGENATPEQPDEQLVETSLLLESSRATAQTGDEVVLTATVAPSDAAGSVEFLLGEAPLAEAVPVEGGTAILALSTLAAGAHSISAAFVPEEQSGFVGSTSEPVTVVIAEAVTEGAVGAATLDWGVKASFRSYLLGPIAHGDFALLGSTKADENMRATGSRFHWTGGTGTAKSDGSAADVGFGAGNGLHLTGHEMSAGGKTANALDMRFTNPRIEIVSPSSGTLYLDVQSRKFEGMSEISEDFYEAQNVPFAALTLPAPTSEATTLSWSDAKASLTEQGAEAFGGFYEAGVELDPLSFSLPLDTDVVTKEPTETTLSVSADKVEVGTAVELTAEVSVPGQPNSAPEGTIVFSVSSSGEPEIRLGEPVAGSRGTATLQTDGLKAGTYTVFARFAPESEHLGHSYGAVQVTIMNKAVTPKPPTTPSMGAGSLQWNVSSRFHAYTTCEDKERYGMSHCAKGSVTTSGVGAGYLFPQSGSSWNPETRTGTVNYSGTVTFSGYGTTMFQVRNPSITVTSPISATLHTGNATPYGAASYQLDLARGQMTVGAGGEVTFSNVAVIGSLSSGGAGGSGNQTIGFDSLTFTVGSASSATYGSTVVGAAVKEKRTPAATPPATTGITVLTAPEKLQPGGRIELEASGFDANDEGVLVVLYSDPIVLDDAAKADRSGRVTWAGKLPDDIAPGTHTITLQGSVNAGAVIEVLPADGAKKAAAAGKKRLSASEIQAERIAGPLGIAGTGGMSPWEWWAAAAGLLLIAACTGTLAVQQRRRAVQLQHSRYQ